MELLKITVEKHFSSKTVFERCGRWLALLVERRTAVREVEGSSPRPD